MVELTKPNAARLAFKIAAGADPHLGFVVLYPDGSLGATDGVSLVLSMGAHDADMLDPLYVAPVGRLHLSGTAHSYALDLAEGVLVERRPRSEASTEVRVSKGEAVPDLHRAMPGSLTPWPDEAPLFDSIIAGRVASEYGLERGVWTRGPGLHRVYLSDAEEGDTVMLAGISRGEVTNAD